MSLNLGAIMRFLTIISLLATFAFSSTGLAQETSLSELRKAQALRNLQQQPVRTPELADMFYTSTRFYGKYSLAIRWDAVQKLAIEEFNLPSPMAVATATRSAVSLLDWSANYGNFQRVDAQRRQQMQQHQQGIHAH